MDLQDKVISLELAKEIEQVAEEKGVELPESEYSHQIQFSLGFYWTIGKSDEGYHGKDVSHIKTPLEYPAYDVAELGEILPRKIGSKYTDVYYLSLENCYAGWGVWYSKGADDAFIKINIKETSEAEARGKMLLYLLKNDLLDNTQKDG